MTPSIPPTVTRFPIACVSSPARADSTAGAKSIRQVPNRFSTTPIAPNRRTIGLATSARLELASHRTALAASRYLFSGSPAVAPVNSKRKCVSKANDAAYRVDRDLGDHARHRSCAPDVLSGRVPREPRAQSSGCARCRYDNHRRCDVPRDCSIRGVEFVLNAPTASHVEHLGRSTLIVGPGTRAVWRFEEASANKLD